MPNIVINQEMKDYVAYAKKKQREELLKAIATVILFAVALVILYYLLWSSVHVV